MNESYDTAISAVLIGYSSLSKAQRAVFMERFNQFVFVSPQQQRRIADDWLRSFKLSPDPAARCVAESAAVYVTERKKHKSAGKK